MVVHFVHACAHREFYKFSNFKKETEVPRWRIQRRRPIFGGPGKKKTRAEKTNIKMKKEFYTVHKSCS